MQTNTGNYFLVKEVNHETITNLHKYVDTTVSRLMNDGKKAAVKVEEYKSPRSLSANGLYWMWLGEIAAYLTKKGRQADKDDLHDLMRHKFLGYNESRAVGKTIIERTLRSTTKLNKSEFCFYMEKVEAWAAEAGCLVTSPLESEYKQFLDKQDR